MMWMFFHSLECVYTHRTEPVNLNCISYCENRTQSNLLGIRLFLCVLCHIIGFPWIQLSSFRATFRVHFLIDIIFNVLLPIHTIYVLCLTCFFFFFVYFVYGNFTKEIQPKNGYCNLNIVIAIVIIIFFVVLFFAYEYTNTLIRM